MNRIRSKKSLMMILALVLIISSAVQSTLAFIVTQTDSIVNIFNPTKSPVSSLVISKTVEHPYGDDYVIPADITFDFKVELGSAYSGTTLLTDKGDVQCDSEGSFVVTLAANSAIGIDGIVDGTEVKVTEITTRNGFALKEGIESTQTLSILPDGGARADFINVYTPSTLTLDNVFLEGEKQLEGRDWAEGDFFEFLLEASVDGEWTALAAAKVEYDAANADYNRFNLSAALQEFEIGNIGDYSFRISEIEGDLENVDYDKTVNYFTVSVSDDDMDGKLEIASVEAKQNVTSAYDEENDIYELYVVFNNTFVPDPEDISVTVTVDKTVNNTGDKEIGPEGFVFLLESVESGETLELVTDKNGAAKLDIVFTHEDIGEYSYKLSEKKGNVVGVTYSDTVYEIVISVDVVDNTLVADIIVNGEAAEDSVFEFTNVYHVVEEPIEPGDKSMIGFYIAMATMALIGAVLLAVAKRMPAEY